MRKWKEGEEATSPSNTAQAKKVIASCLRIGSSSSFLKHNEAQKLRAKHVFYRYAGMAFYSTVTLDLTASTQARSTS